MAKPTDQPPVTEDTELVTINGRHYFKSSLGEEEIKAFEQAMDITNEIEVKNKDIRNLNYARQFLADYLEKNNADWKEFIPPEAPETKDAPVAETNDETTTDKAAK